jgi:hypothetical protein
MRDDDDYVVIKMHQLREWMCTKEVTHLDSVCVETMQWDRGKSIKFTSPGRCKTDKMYGAEIMNRMNKAAMGLMWTGLLMTQACGWETVDGNGIEAVEVREYSGFDRVEVEGGSFDTVDIYVCECNKIRITGDENLLPYVETQVDGDTLELDTEANLRTDVPLVVEIYTTSLERVDVSGSSNIRVIDLSGGSLTVNTSGSSDVKLKGVLDHLLISTSGSSDVDIVELDSRHLEVETSGSSDLDLHGEVEVFELRTSGSSDVRARELEAQRVTIRTSGSSDVEVCVTESLDVSVSGSGDVDYYCDPASVTRNVSGSGDVRGH